MTTADEAKVDFMLCLAGLHGQEWASAASRFAETPAGDTDQGFIEWARMREQGVAR